MQTFGSRAEVFHGTALKTTGGLTQSDLVQDKYGSIISIAARKAAVKRMKREGKKALVKVFKPKKKGFGLQPKEGTKAYEKKIKKML
tara:strand:- start:1486 stop:1746 length:261 start_codon:yes stop_codon:yes gene_type:complete